MDRPLRIVVAGHVDHGKSTLIARLLHECGALPDGAADAARAASDARGYAEFEWAYLLDALQSERDQAVTIDIAHYPMKTKARNIVLIDAPGHREFLRNMMTGAAASDAAILVVDAGEGVCAQTRRHAMLLSLCGVVDVIAAVTKMDRAGFSKEKFDAIQSDLRVLFSDHQLVMRHCVPVSARDGDNIAARSGGRMDWYDGPALLDALDDVPGSSVTGPVRFVVQDVYKSGDDRIVAGRVDGGAIRAGDELLFLPLGEITRVQRFAVWPEGAARDLAGPGDCVGMVMQDRLFVERGHVGSPPATAPAMVSGARVRVFWMADRDLVPGDECEIAVATRIVPARVDRIERAVRGDDLDVVSHPAACVRFDVADVVLRFRDPIPLDDGADGGVLGRALILCDGAVAGAGRIDLAGFGDLRAGRKPVSANLHAVHGFVDHTARMARHGYGGAVFWLTGLSGAGKSTLAVRVERALFDRGVDAYVLDGDNVRAGLNADLGFSAQDRSENIRRVAAVSALMADAGLVVVTAFISPFRDDRDRARMAAPGRFHEIYVRADLGTCESRDPKGLYARARAGKIVDFTGIDSPYEEPDYPDMIVDTQENNVDTCVSRIVDYILSSITPNTDQPHE